MATKKSNHSETGRAIAKAILEEYKPTNREEMQDAIKDIFGPMFEAILQGEMDAHLGYGSNDRGAKGTENRRNGYTDKTIKTTMGDVAIRTPRDRDASFDPQLIPKRSRDVSGIEDKVLAMYARGMSQRDIAETIEDIYGFEISHETISSITKMAQHAFGINKILIASQGCQKNLHNRSPDQTSLMSFSSISSSPRI